MCWDALIAPFEWQPTHIDPFLKYPKAPITHLGGRVITNFWAFLLPRWAPAVWGQSCITHAVCFVWHTTVATKNRKTLEGHLFSPPPVSFAVQKIATLFCQTTERLSHRAKKKISRENRINLQDASAYQDDYTLKNFLLLCVCVLFFLRWPASYSRALSFINTCIIIILSVQREMSQYVRSIPEVSRTTVTARCRFDAYSLVLGAYDLFGPPVPMLMKNLPQRHSHTPSRNVNLRCRRPHVEHHAKLP